MNTPNKSQLSRRNLLQVLGIGTAGLAVAACQPVEVTSSAGAATAASNGSIPSATSMADVPASVAAKRFPVGDFELTVLRDGTLEVPPAMLAVNAPEGSASDLLAGYNLPTDATTLSVAAVLIDTGDGLALIDTGSGSGENAGQLVPTLALLGVEPAAIESVLLTHLHPDHVGGASIEGEITFPNAQYYISQIEWETIEAGPTGGSLDGAIEGASAKLAPIVANDQLAFYSDGDEVIPGIQAVAVLGHTPGHHALLLGSGGEQLLYVADSVAHNIVHFEHPEWAFAFDNDPEAAIEARRQILGRAADEQLPILAAHLPFATRAYVARDGEAFRYIAVE